MFTPLDSDHPWTVQSLTNPGRPMFLLYDTVHILKNIRNNWYSEATKTLCFPTDWEIDDNNEVSATTTLKSDLAELYKRESNLCNLLKLSKLKANSVAPNNTEKQNVSLVLDVFCDMTSSALKSTRDSTQSMKDTACCIDMILKFWKLVNCKVHLRQSDLRTVTELS